MGMKRNRWLANFVDTLSESLAYWNPIFFNFIVCDGRTFMAFKQLRVFESRLSYPILCFGYMVKNKNLWKWINNWQMKTHDFIISIETVVSTRNVWFCLHVTRDVYLQRSWENVLKLACICNVSGTQSATYLKHLFIFIGMFACILCLIVS